MTEKPKQINFTIVPDDDTTTPLANVVAAYLRK